MKHTTERKWHSWLNGVELTICPSMWGRQRRLLWTSGETPLTTPHWPSTARLWRESAALNSWGCTSQRISPGPPTPCHSPRSHNSAYTFSAGWKEQVSLHPSSPHSTGAPLRVCWPAASLSGTGKCSAADRKTLQRTVNTAAKIIGAPLPSILDIFITQCSSKTNSIMKDPTHPSHSLFQLLPSGRWYRSIRARSARLLNSFFPQAVRALNSNYPAPFWNPMQTPTSWNMDHLTPPLQTPPNLTTPKKKLYETFLCNSKCATHRWVGLYKPPVVTHSPLCALDTFHTLLCVHNPTKDSAIYVCLHAHAPQIILYCSPASCLTHNVSLCTCTVFMWSIRIVCIYLFFIF